MAEDNDVTAAELVIRRGERAAARGGDAEDVEEISRHRRSLHPLTIDPSVDVGRLRERTREHTGLADERVILRAREALGLRAGRSLTFDREQLVRVAHLVHTEDERVEEREHDGYQSESKPHCRHYRYGHKGRTPERA